jgi:hypothetical protein
MGTFQVLTAESMKMTAFWDIAPFNLVVVDHKEPIQCNIPEGYDLQ